MTEFNKIYRFKELTEIERDGKKEIINISDFMHNVILSHFLNNLKTGKENLKWSKKVIADYYNIGRPYLDKILKDLKDWGYLDYSTKRHCSTLFKLTDKALKILEHDKTKSPNSKKGKQKIAAKPTFKDKSTKSDTTQNNNEEKDIKSLNVEEQIKLNKERKDNKLKNKKQLGFI